MPSPATLVRQRVKEVFEAEFADRNWTVENDKLLRAHGYRGVDRIACFPEAERERPGRVDQLEIPVVLQVYLAFNPDIDEEQAVDPSIIEGIGDRLRRAFHDNSSGNTNDLWFLRLSRIEYPDDPTGNKSRLEAYIIGFAANPAGTY